MGKVKDEIRAAKEQADERKEREARTYDPDRPSG
jgi:hypothetical protein